MSLANGVNTHTMRSLGPAGAVGFAAIKQENERLRSMTDELGHRIKNLVAVMQSISRQTMHHTTTKDDFEVRFSGRIGALGRSIDCLMANDWHEARIDELVRLELTTFGALDGAQFWPKGQQSACNRMRRATLVLRCTSWQPTPANMERSRCQKARLPCIGSLSTVANDSASA